MSHWQRYHARWSQIRPPLRPDEDVVKAIVKLVGGRGRKVLLLGVTPEFADAFDNVQAVDKNPAMIANLWPGDGATKKASLGDWLEMSGETGCSAPQRGSKRPRRLSRRALFRSASQAAA